MLLKYLVQLDFKQFILDIYIYIEYRCINMYMEYNSKF